MYIARDSDGTLRVFGAKPERCFYFGNDGKGYWYEGWGGSIELDKEEDYYPKLKWEDEPIKVLPMAVTKDNELKDWWMAAPTLNAVSVFADPVSAENFAQNNFKDEGLKVWHCTHE